MSEPGPFDRMLEPGSGDRTARLILIGMGVIGVILLILVLSPISLFGGGDGGAGEGGAAAPSGTTRLAKAPKAPEGYEALSRLEKIDEKQQCPCTLIINLIEPISDGRNLSLYTNRGGKWERLATATLMNNGTAASGVVEVLPANLVVFRRTASAVQISGWLPAGAQADADALDVVATLNPVDYAPAADGTLAGSASILPEGSGNVMPTVRASTQPELDAVNSILSSPGLRDAHINALVEVASRPSNAGIDLDYRGVNAARKADFTGFIKTLADRLHQANRSLSLTLPTPTKTGVSWDTGAYDWQEISQRADVIKIAGEPDPSVYYRRMDEVLNFLKDKVDLKKLVLILTRHSVEKGTDGTRTLSLYEGLSLASSIEVRTTSAITPNSSVVIVGKNIFQDDGASGLRWDAEAFAVSFTYPGRGGPRTVWLENALSVAFRIDLARRYGLGGVAVDNVSLDPRLAAIWQPLREYLETGGIRLAQPNGVMLRPTWQAQAGQTEAGTQGNLVWKAPAQPGAYDISLIVSDGVIKAYQKIVLTVQSPGATPAPTAAGTRAPGTTPAASPTRTPTATPRP